MSPLILIPLATVLVTNDPAATPPCGPAALYALVRLEGLRVDLPTVLARFASPADGGHSLAEIRDAARGLGLHLEGVHLMPEGWPSDRPALVFLKRGEHGHFVVVRRVGHTGKLVQVIDGPRSVEVVDRDLLTSDSSWTGLALVPTRGSLRPLLLPIGLVVVAAVSLVAWLTGGLRSRPLNASD